MEYARKAASEYSHLIINSNPEDFESRQAYDEDYKDKVRQLAICYHNLSVEENHFANPDKSLEYSKKAYQLMKSKFGENNNITSKFKANYYSKLNNEPNENKSVFSMRPLSEKGKPRRSASKTSLTRKLPEWKIKSNPYGTTQRSKFHNDCNPHPEFSQHAKKQAPRHNNWLQQTPAKPSRQPVTLKVKRGTRDRIGSAKPLSRPEREDDHRHTNEKDQGRKLEFKATLQELEELGATSSDDSEEERETRMKANRKKFGQTVGVEDNRKEKAVKALASKQENDVKNQDAERKNKREQDKQRAIEVEIRKEQEQKEKISKEKGMFSSGQNIANFLTAKELIDKQHSNSRTAFIRCERFPFYPKDCSKAGFSHNCPCTGDT